MAWDRSYEYLDLLQPREIAEPTVDLRDEHGSLKSKTMEELSEHRFRDFFIADLIISRADEAAVGIVKQKIPSLSQAPHDSWNLLQKKADVNMIR